MNSTNSSHILSSNISTLWECMEDTSRSLVGHLVSLVRMEQTLTDGQHREADEEAATKYEVTFIPVIVLLLITEQIVRLVQRKALCRFQDFVINLGASLIFVLSRSLIISGIVFLLYYIHDEYHLVELPADSVWTWILTLLLGELSLYWTHRAMHEINILWAGHYFHHMTEDLNFSATIRATILDLFLYDIFPIPLAVIIPPQLLVYHIQLSFLWQIWLHNEVVGDLGPIEYLINTPRQHRVHHGKNRYCIDKNYGTTIMLWDRLFGTYQAYEERPVLGLVSQTPHTFDSITLQFGYYWQMLRHLGQYESVGDKAAVIWKGPGWAPGKPRLGRLDDVPLLDPNVPKYGYDPHIPYWKKFYALIHLSILMLAFMQLADHSTITYTSCKVMAGVVYVIMFLTTIGALFDNRPVGQYVETIRCGLYFGYEYYFMGSFNWSVTDDQLTLVSTLMFIRSAHVLSIIFWLIYITNNWIRDHKKQPNSEKMANTSDTSPEKRQVVSTKVEECVSATKRVDPLFEKTVFVVAMIFIIVSFLFAYALNRETCVNVFNQMVSD